MYNTKQSELSRAPFLDDETYAKTTCARSLGQGTVSVYTTVVCRVHKVLNGESSSEYGRCENALVKIKLRSSRRHVQTKHESSYDVKMFICAQQFLNAGRADGMILNVFHKYKISSRNFEDTSSPAVHDECTFCP